MGNMTFKIEVLEPHGQERLEELFNLKLIKFVKTPSRKRKVDTEPVQSREEILAGFADSVREVRAAIRGEIQLRSIYDVLDEMEAEQKLENAERSHPRSAFSYVVSTSAAKAACTFLYFLTFKFLIFRSHIAQQIF
jgi:hypothetical protein